MNQFSQFFLFGLLLWNIFNTFSRKVFIEKKCYIYQNIWISVLLSRHIWLSFFVITFILHSSHFLCLRCLFATKCLFKFGFPYLPVKWNKFFQSSLLISFYIKLDFPFVYHIAFLLKLSFSIKLLYTFEEDSK